MSDLIIALVYFSATHVTKTYAEVVKEELISRGCQAQLINVTAYSFCGGHKTSRPATMRAGGPVVGRRVG